MWETALGGGLVLAGVAIAEFSSWRREVRRTATETEHYWRDQRRLAYASVMRAAVEFRSAAGLIAYRLGSDHGAQRANVIVAYDGLQAAVGDAMLICGSEATDKAARALTKVAASLIDPAEQASQARGAPETRELFSQAQRDLAMVTGAFAAAAQAELGLDHLDVFVTVEDLGL